jgi:hypothetical protein
VLAASIGALQLSQLLARRRVDLRNLPLRPIRNPVLDFVAERTRTLEVKRVDRALLPRVQVRKSVLSDPAHPEITVQPSAGLCGF